MRCDMNSSEHKGAPQHSLDALLDAWDVQLKPTHSLSVEVWRRIALSESKKPTLWEQINVWLSRPSLAVLFVTSCAVVGLLFAEIRVHNQQHDQNIALARSYLQLIDPLLKADTKTP